MTPLRLSIMWMAVLFCYSGCKDDRTYSEPKSTPTIYTNEAKALLPEYFVCIDEVKRPDGVDAQTALQRIDSQCKKRIFKKDGFDACLAAAIAKAMNACKSDTSPRENACREMARPPTKQWVKEIRDDILSDLKVRDDLSEIAAVVGGRVAKKATGPCSMDDTRILVYDSSDIQAMAIPGGPVLISSGLMLQVDESELAFAIGHELAHIRWGSSDLAVLTRYIDNKRLLSELSDVVDIAVSACRGPLDESFVDIRGAFDAIDAGYDPMAAPRFFATILKDERPMIDLRWENSHPPSAMRATDTWWAVKWYTQQNKSTTKVFFRGSRDQVGLWDLSIPDVVATRCGVEQSPAD